MLALAIFVATLALVLIQPRGLGIGWSAMGGAALAWATGVVNLADVATVWGIVWDATFTFVALILISLILDGAGCFAWAALHIARLAGGRTRVLFVYVVLLGALIAAIFANDGAALLLTPIVVAILARLGLAGPTALAFIIATGFIADTASLPLTISNLVNIVTANYFGIGFDRYALIMAPVALVSIATTLGVLVVFFARDLPNRYTRDALAEPAAAVVDRQVFYLAGPLLVVLLAALFGLAAYDVPFSIVIGSVAGLLLLVAARVGQARERPRIALKPVVANAPWPIVWFSLGMYIVVYGLGQAGLTAHAAGVLAWLAGQGHFIATVGTGFVVAATAAVMNNMPATLVASLAIDQVPVDALTRELMIHASIIGNDLGPKFTPIGSLATLLWLHVLAGKGHAIGWGQYMKIGLILTPPVLLAALVALWAWLPVANRLAGG